jgi:predicted acyl esterase
MWFGDVAHDQRPTDAFSLVYDTEPIENDFEILGLPRAILKVSADAPMADWFARLSDVSPDGTVTLVASAGLNGSHRDSDRDPRPLEPGRRVSLDIEMHFTSWVFSKGHRMRLSVSNAQWPVPAAVALAVVVAAVGTWMLRQRSRRRALEDVARSLHMQGRRPSADPTGAGLPDLDESSMEGVPEEFARISKERDGVRQKAMGLASAEPEATAQLLRAWMVKKKALQSVGSGQNVD